MTDLWNALFGLGAIAIIFVVLREFFCWYFKINLKIEKMNELNQNLIDIRHELKRARIKEEVNE